MGMHQHFPLAQIALRYLIAVRYFGQAFIGAQEETAQMLATAIATR